MFLYGLFRQFTIGKGKLNDQIHNTRTHFGPSLHPQNSIKLPDYSREIRQFPLTVRTNIKKNYRNLLKENIFEYQLMLTFQF